MGWGHCGRKATFKGGRGWGLCGRKATFKGGRGWGLCGRKATFTEERRMGWGHCGRKATFKGGRGGFSVDGKQHLQKKGGRGGVTVDGKQHWTDRGLCDAETVRTVRDGKPWTATSTFTQFPSSERARDQTVVNKRGDPTGPTFIVLAFPRLAGNRMQLAGQ